MGTVFSFATGVTDAARGDWRNLLLGSSIAMITKRQFIEATVVIAAFLVSAAVLGVLRVYPAETVEARFQEVETRLDKLEAEK